MKRKCRRGVQIDALTTCHEVVNAYYYEQLSLLPIGGSMDVEELSLTRIEGRYFDNVYAISLWNGTRRIDWGFLKFNLSRRHDGDTTEGDLRKVWLSVNNETLYSLEDFALLTYIEGALGLSFHHITALDLCIDTPFAVAPLVRANLRSRDVATILNGKRITDRDEDRPELRYVTSGSLNNQRKYFSVCVKQRNALHDKTKGISVQLYDKAAEIRNSSEKEYILQHYGSPKKLYRTEVHLNTAEVRGIAERLGLECSPLLLLDFVGLERIFFSALESVLRFRGDGGRVTWRQMLGRPDIL